MNTNFTNIEQNQVEEIKQSQWRSIDEKMNQSNQYQLEYDSNKKKEKRNRKFFLKRSASLLSICKQTGRIEFQFGSDFLHIEIMQGGHFPLNSYNLKDIQSEIYGDDQECQSSNVLWTLETASKGIQKKVRNLQSQLNYKSLAQIQQQHKEINEFCNNNQLKENQISQIKMQYFDEFQVKTCDSKQANNIAKAKQILVKQYQLFKQFIQS